MRIRRDNKNCGNFINLFMKKLFFILIFINIILIVDVHNIFASVIQLPQTGQTNCYDSIGNIISCAGTGQDGDIRAGISWPEPRFTVTNNGTTITDNLTGLMWNKNVNTYSSPVVWQSALDWIKKMNIGIYSNFNYTDWHLPNINEFESLINIDRSDISIWLKEQGFNYVSSCPYWSSTSLSEYGRNALVVPMSFGYVLPTTKSGSNGCIWSVRQEQSGSSGQLWKSGQVLCYDDMGNKIDCFNTGQDGEIKAGVSWPELRFIDNENGIISDNLTGLIWAKDANLPKTYTNWQQALDYVKKMNTGIYSNFGYTDWRLPNRKELYSLIDFSQYNSAISSGHPFLNVQSHYWSSSSFVYNPAFAWIAYMGNGSIQPGDKLYGSGYRIFVWPVRSGLCEKCNIKPSFWSRVQNITNNWLNLRQTPGTQNKSVDEIIKTLPNGWAVKIASTTDENGVYIDKDGYRWYKIEDKSDGTTGWMAAKNLTDGIIYLDYDQSKQSELQNKAETQLDTTDKRKPVILDAVNNYHARNNFDNSLYGGGGGFDGLNNFQKFIQGSNFPKELVLAISAKESGSGFNNEICSQTKDGGIGIMQITSAGFKGLGSALNNILHKNDCTAGYIGNLTKYYSNTLQGIYANIKDGFRVLQEKYSQKCPKVDEIIEGYTFTCQDIEKILTTWGYNGFAVDEDTGLYTGNYLKYVADKLKNLSIYFSGVIYSNNDNFIEKLEVANNNKQVIRLYSPAVLRIVDGTGNITGVVGDTIKEDIPNSLYEKDAEAAVIFFPKDSYRYRVIGIANASYSFSVDFVDKGVFKKFNANNILIKIGEIHEYIIDWDALFRGEAGIMLQIDYDGDNIFDKNFVSDETLTQEDIFFQLQTIIDFEPDTFNLESNGIATAYIELPAGYNVNDISASSLRLNKIIFPLPKPMEVGDYDKDGIPDLMIKFEREKIKSVVTAGEKIPITIIGKVFYNGNYYHFKGQDMIKIINNNKSGTMPNSTVSRWAWTQKIFNKFNNLEGKIIAVFYGILR